MADAHQRGGVEWTIEGGYGAEVERADVHQRGGLGQAVAAG